MDKSTGFGFLLQLMLTLNSIDSIVTYDINAVLSSASNKTTIFRGEAQFDYATDEGYAYFYGIRYGQSERFQKSSIYEYEDQKTVDAKQHGNVCSQQRKDNSLIAKEDKMSEDCLLLNIIVPLDHAVQDLSSIARKKAVYIFIHGGVFTRGSSNLYVWSDFAMHGDFILITINYRLGIFGFLTTDDDVIPANLGLWDQQLAITWVKENIGAFGGDSSRITVGGQSAGSMSAILQSFYPGNDDLFQNTISESGSPFAPTIITEKGLPTAMEVADRAGCDLDIASTKGEKLSQELLACLKGKSASFLASFNDVVDPPLGPVLDYDFIAKETFELCPQGVQRFVIPDSISSSFANKNFLTGFTTNDGEILLALTLERLMNTLAISDRDTFIGKPITPGVLRVILGNYLLKNKTEDALVIKTLVNSIMEYYTDWSQPTSKVATSFSAIKIMTEYFFVNPGVNVALLHSVANACGRLRSSNCGNASRSTYLYELHFPPSSILAVNSDFSWFHGTRHGAEMFLFADTAIKKTLPNMTNTLYTTLSNFINTGNPNSKVSKDSEESKSTEWEMFTEKSQDMYLVTDESALKSTAYTKSNHFWQGYLPQLRDDIHSALQKGKLLTTNDTIVTNNSKCSTSTGSNAAVRHGEGKLVTTTFFVSLMAALSLTF